MCGIWGYQFVESEPPFKHGLTSRAILVTLLMCEMEERGSDSWGFAIRTPQPSPDAPDGIAVIKDIGPCTKCVDPQIVASCLQVAAHTRKATAGSVCKANAHPFRIKHIVGMHNGGVSNHQWLNSKYKRSCDVDSEHIFHHLADGLDTNELGVYGAAVWIDTTDPDGVHLLRSTAGQLAVRSIQKVGNTDIVGVAWCSTDLALERALALAGYASTEVRLTGEKHYTVRSGGIKETAELPFSQTFPRLPLPKDSRTAGRFQSVTTPSYVGAPCHTCGKFAEYTYMEWVAKTGGWICWNCSPPVGV